MRFSLRTLIVVMLLGGPVLAGAWWGLDAYRRRHVGTYLCPNEGNIQAIPLDFNGQPISRRQD